MKVRVAFSGSGFLTPVHVGAATAFIDAGCEIIEVAGTSGGCICAAFIAAGISPAKMKLIAIADLPHDILDFELYALLKDEGLNDGSTLLEWLKGILGSLKMGQSLVPVTISATDINAGKQFNFSNTETPDVLMADACRASASVPFVFSPHKTAGRKFVDGGVCCNLPIDDLIVDEIPRFGIQVIDGTTEGTTDTFIGLTTQLIGTMMASNQANMVEFGIRTGATIIPVSAITFGFLNARLTMGQKIELFNRGYDAVKKALQ